MSNLNFNSKTVLFIIICLIAYFLVFDNVLFQNMPKQVETASNPVERIKKPLKGPELEKWYFSDWHQPYDNVLPSDVMNRIWNGINELPDEREFDNPPTQWTCIGPKGMKVNPNIKWSGRILDIQASFSVPAYIGSASGGLWAYNMSTSNWVPLTDSLTSLSIGAFSMIVGGWLIGTGEPYVRRGTGLWRTTDNGYNWTNPAMNPGTNPNPKWFYKIKEDGTWGYIGYIHAATDTGYYRSTNFGASWTRTLAGETTDLAQHPNSNVFQDLFTAVWGGTNQGIWKSTDLGVSWTKLSGGLPTSNIGRTSLSFSVRLSSYPLYTALYAAIARLDNNQFMGVYKSTNRGDNWTNVTSNLPANIFGSQGWYDNVISAEIYHPDTVAVGGVSLYRTFNGGASWSLVNDTNVHADHHAAYFNTGLFECNDGGLSYSSNGGINWSTSFNEIPITQYYGFDAGTNNPNVIFGGAQDVGISGTVNGGANWNMVHFPGIGGDGAGISINPANSSDIFGILGVYGGGIAFQRFRSTNTGQTWSAINSGISSDGNWAPKIRYERNNPQTLYTNANNYVYKSTNSGTSWTALNSAPFASQVTNLTVARFSGGSSVVYACLNSSDPANKLKVYDGGSWYERSAGFPANTRVRTVAQHPSNNNRAYALMNGVGVPPPNKIFKTFNRGVTWIDITGNLPDLPLGDLVPHPTDTNILYLGTEMGCYKTTNGGVSWIKWNTGMPKANIITEMTYVDSTAINGKFYVMAASYGRSIWLRQIDDAITGVVNNNNLIPGHFALYQNYPNPFNPSCKIKYSLAKESVIKLTVYDILGREVRVLINEKKPAGNYSLEFNAEGLSSGVYFYKLKTDSFEETKKMLLVK
ncbi:MAG: T9SS type A sorting domain-containing protein [Chlorobi bacterium]|nr:T9SS type A sorting domain-containing protein [Chlorobiota bacterium]